MTESRPRGRPRTRDADAPYATVRAVDRSIDVLEALAGGNGLALSELAVALDQSPATLHRVLATLEARGMVEVEPASQSWRIGAGAFRIGSAFLRRGGVLEISRPEMRALMEDTGETANLGIERGGQVLFIGQVETQESIRAFFPPGMLSPMHASGIGKALLGHFSEKRLEAWLRGRSLEAFTARSIVQPERLRNELDSIRSRGFAIDDEERTEGMRCVAAPVLNAYGEAVAGISISGPTSRVTAEAALSLGARVAAAAERISCSLGAPVG